MEKKAEKKHILSKLILSAGFGAAATAVFVWYVTQNRASYKPTDFIVPFITLALFTAVLVLAVPKIIRLFTGAEEFPAAEKKKPYLTLIVIILAALAVHFAAMLIGVLIYSRLQGGMSFAKAFRQAWMKSNTDAGHYINIAENWYQKEGHDNLLIVFFPMLPVMIRLFNLVTKDSFVSALIINAVSTSLASGLCYLTLRGVLGQKRAVVSAFIAILLPGAIFMNSPMSEPLFLLFTLAAFLLMQNKRYVWAGVFVALSGFTRSLGVLSAIPLALTGLNQIIGLIRAKKKWGETAILLFVGLLLSTLGTLAYLLINAVIHGNPFQFFEYQWSNWHQKACPFFDTTRYIFSYAGNYLKSDMNGFVSLWLPQIIAIFGVLALMLWGARKLPASYTVYFLLYFAVSVGCTWLLSSVRYLSAGIPVIAALGYACDKRWKSVVMIAVLIVVYMLYMYMYMKRMGIY